jgi:hypothetical protein
VTALFVREVVGDVCSGAETVLQLATGRQPELDGERFTFIDGSSIRVIEAGNDRRLTTTADNVSHTFFHPTGSGVIQAMSISGDRVVWIDARSGSDRVIVGDIADLSTRVLTRTPTTDGNVTLEGDVLSYAVQTETTFLNDGGLYTFGLEPDLPQLYQNPGPTRLRCPSDDIFEENDSRLTAQPINSGAVINGIVCPNDSDRFAIAVASNCTIRARARFQHSEGNLNVQLFDPNDVLVGTSASFSDDEILNLSGTVAGTYNVRVFGANASVQNTYDLGVNVTCP